VKKKGMVKWFDKSKGFGFIVPEEGGSDVFVHYSDIEGEEGEYKTLIDGQHVEYEEATGDRGKKAKNVTVVPKGNGNA
jgi:CspA family cold shock protein